MCSRFREGGTASDAGRLANGARTLWQKVIVKVSNAFKEQIVIAATAANLSIVFDDPELEQRRLRLADPTTTQP